MKHIVLAAMIFVGVEVFACEDSGDFSSTKADPVALRMVPYPALSPDALEKIYDPKEEVHRLSIVRKEDMPRCLQDVEGPFPFYGHSADARLGSLRTYYFASLQFDNPRMQEATERMRSEAVKIKESDPMRALELLYNSGWKMGDPLSVKMLVELLVEVQSYGKRLMPKDSNLIAVLRGYPKSVSAMLRTIIASRGTIDYNRRRSSSESFRTGSDDDVSESEGVYPAEGEGASLMGDYERSGVRQRYKKDA